MTLLKAMMFAALFAACGALLTFYGLAKPPPVAPNGWVDVRTAPRQKEGNYGPLTARISPNYSSPVPFLRLRQEEGNYGPLTATPYTLRSTATCVTNAAGGTVMSTALAAALSPRIGWEAQDDGPNAIWCSGAGVVPVVGGPGRKIASGSTWTYDQTTSFGDPTAVVTCIAETALQVAPACTILSEGF